MVDPECLLVQSHVFTGSLAAGLPTFSQEGGDDDVVLVVAAAEDHQHVHDHVENLAAML
jgi:hypothetical protein